MKKIIFISLLILLTNSFINLNAQVFSETELQYSKNGERLSKFIYIKLKSGGFVSNLDASNIANGNSISELFSNVKKIINAFCKEKGIELSQIKIKKAIPKAQDTNLILFDALTKEHKKTINLSRIFTLWFPMEVDVDKISSELRNQIGVEYSHGPVQFVNCAEYPNDSYYSNGDQWYLNRIDAPNAWSITKGKSVIKIALIEWHGVDITHNDLQSKIAGGDNNPNGILGTHGTVVAGLAAGHTHNNLGIASLGWNIGLLTYQPATGQSDPQFYSTAQKIYDAVYADAKVINLSFKTIKTDLANCNTLSKSNLINSAGQLYYKNWSYPLIEEAVEYAIASNVVVVAAAGNTNDEVGEYLPCESIPYTCYPANYTGVIAVSGSQYNNTFVDGWNYGSHVSVNAPGRTDGQTGLWSTSPTNNYINDLERTGGTSISTPQVSALAALIKSIKESLIPSQIKTIIENSADKIGQYSYTNGRNDYFGYGRINAYKALKYTVENYGGTFNQNVTIPAGDTWNLQPGVTLSFDPGYSLIVNGTLNAVGNSSNRITFTRNGSSGAWGGIQFNSGSSGNLQYCNIQYATYGVYSYGTGPIIKYSNFEYNTNTGLYCSYYSSPVLVGNNFRYNGQYGVRCDSYSSPNLTDNGYSGSNVIRSNGAGLYATYYSNPYLPGYQATGNSIFDNNGWEVAAMLYCTINAQRVYWGSGSSVYAAGGSTIDNTNPLPEPNPNPNRAVIGDDKNLASLSAGVKLSKVNDDISTALEKQKEKKYNEAIPLFLEVFKNNKEELVGKYALTKIEECFTQSGRKDYLEYSKKEIKPLIKDGTETFVEALELETHQLLNQGLYNETVVNLKTILKKYKLNDAIEKYTLLNLGSFYSIFLGDKENSEKYFEELSKKFPKDELVNQIDVIKKFGSKTNNAVQNAQVVSLSEEIESNDSKNESDELVSNYPNPFNPTTVISYRLSAISKVSLRVYDILGREVATLVDEIKPAGNHSALFTHHSTLASGVYFYRLVTPTQTITKKMLLAK